jgi:hypothetical protein
MSYLGKVAKHENVLEAAEDMVEQEREWLHHRLGLIPDHDDDVMDEQKVSSCSFVGLDSPFFFSSTPDFIAVSALSALLPSLAPFSSRLST